MQHTKVPMQELTFQKPSFNIIFDLRDVLFLYHALHRGTPQQFTAIKDMIAVLHQIYAQTDHIGKPRHRLFVLSNATTESYHNFITHHPTIFSYFEGIVVSAISGFKKPDERAYLYILQKYNLIPEQCIFIDDKEENIVSAQSVGMHGIVYTTPAQVQHALKNFKVL